MTQQLNEDKKAIIMDILQSSNILEKINKFRLYQNKLGDCRIFLFDENESKFDDHFKNKKIGQCGIFGIGDYTKTWVLDSEHNSGWDLVQAGKTIDFDLNVLTYLNRLMLGRKININKKEFIDYLNYLKIEGFQIGIVTALMERMQTKVDLNILSEMIMSFVKFDNISRVSMDFDNIYLSHNDYIRIEKIYNIALRQKEAKLEQFDLLCCCVMKAYLIKTYDIASNKTGKVEKFINYCLKELSCYLEKEIVMLSLYIMDDSKTNRRFKKLKSNANIIKNILNVTWDIYHIRFIEQIMLWDNIKNVKNVILSYFGTADNGIIDAMQINPVKAFVIMNNYPITIHQKNIEDVCKNEKILENIYWNANTREKKIKELNFTKIKEKLQCEILEKVDL